MEATPEALRVATAKARLAKLREREHALDEEVERVRREAAATDERLRREADAARANVYYLKIRTLEI